MEKLIIDINNPFHPLNMDKYPEEIQNESFSIDLNSETQLNVHNGAVIDWGDQTTNDTFREHIYSRDTFPLFYRIEIEYDPNSDVDFLNFKYNKYIKRVMGPLPRVSTHLLTGYFKGCTNLEMIGKDVFKYNDRNTNISELFLNCENLEYIDPDSKLSQFATNIDGILKNCHKFTELPKIFNFECIETANESFMNMSGIKRIPMNYLDKAINLRYAASIFEGCVNLRQMGYNPLYNCKSLKNASRAFAGIDTNLLKIKDNFFTYIPKDCVIDDIFTN